MNELIRITEHDGKRAVSARELHTFLEAKKQFSDWIKHRIQKYGFIEGVDYVSFSLIGENGGRSIEYALSISCAKELSMVEGNAKGKQARGYFIEKEAQAGKAYLIASEYEKRIAELEGKMKLIEANTSIVADMFTIVGYARMCNFHLSPERSQQLGKAASNICRKRGITISTVPDARYGYVHTYPRDILKEVFNNCLI